MGFTPSLSDRIFCLFCHPLLVTAITSGRKGLHYPISDLTAEEPGFPCLLAAGLTWQLSRVSENRADKREGRREEKGRKGSQSVLHLQDL